MTNPRELDLHQGLNDSDLDADPIVQLRRWLEDAVAGGLPEPYAMTLATATPDGQPSARMVLLRGCDAQGLAFFTDFRSRKARELLANPRAAVVLFWAELNRQVRAEGRIEEVSPAQADAYWQSRPRGHRLAATASNQSETLPDRSRLEQRVAELELQYPGDDVPRPDYWSGFRLVPHAVEFWKSRLNRLHDRFRYERQDDGTWQRQRLSP